MAHNFVCPQNYSFPSQNSLVCTTCPNWPCTIGQIETKKVECDYLIVSNRGEADITKPEDLTVMNLESFGVRWLFVPFWSWRIPADIYEQWDVVIFHMTDVPYGRGGQPLRNLIVRGQQQTMLTALKCVEEWDAGPVYMKLAFDISTGTAAEIYDRADKLIRDVMIPFIVKYRPTPVPQRGEVTVFHRWQCEDKDIVRVLTNG